LPATGFAAPCAPYVQFPQIDDEAAVDAHRHRSTELATLAKVLGKGGAHRGEARVAAAGDFGSLGHRHFQRTAVAKEASYAAPRCQTIVSGFPIVYELGGGTHP